MLDRPLDECFRSLFGPVKGTKSCLAEAPRQRFHRPARPHTAHTRHSIPSHRSRWLLARSRIPAPGAHAARLSGSVLPYPSRRAAGEEPRAKCLSLLAKPSGAQGHGIQILQRDRILRPCSPITDPEGTEEVAAGSVCLAPSDHAESWLFSEVLTQFWHNFGFFKSTTSSTRDPQLADLSGGGRGIRTPWGVSPGGFQVHELHRYYRPLSDTKGNNSGLCLLLLERVVAVGNR